MDLIERDRRHIWHPFTQMKENRQLIGITKAKGASLYAEDGTRYIDAISSWWVNIHGHSHPAIVKAVATQARKLEHVIFADFTHAPAVNLAERLCTILPGNMSKIFFSDNGSTAVEVALKMALQYWHNQGTSRRLIVSLEKGYHGDTFGAMAAAGRNEFNRPFWNHLFEVRSIPAPVFGQETEAYACLESILTREQVAAFIFEPLVMGSGGMIMHSPPALDALLALCKKHNVITIADEVMTGFGRTETLFATEQVAQKPDIICLSKGITGGFLPLGVTACKQEIFEAFLGDNLGTALLHGHSYTANPLACISALASLELLLSEKCFKQRERIQKFHEKFCEKWKKHPLLTRIDCKGTILVLEYQSNAPSYFNSLRNKLYKHFMSEGILLRPLGNVVYVMPPYCISKKELSAIYAAIETTLKEPSWMDL